MRPLIPAAFLLPLLAATLSAQSLRLEAERAPEEAAHPAHYAAARFPDDKWWSDVSFPGGTIAAIRGNDGSHGAHRLIWNLEIPESTEQTLVHDVRARVLISHNGAYNLSFQVDDAVPLKTTAEADKGTWQWVTLGSVLLPPGTHRLALEITTNASAVRVDAVELIPVPDVLAVHALPEPVWVAGEPNAFFIEADAAELSFRLPSARFSSAVARAIGPFGTSTQTLEAVIAPEHPDTIRVRVPARGWWQVQVRATRDGQTHAQTQKSFSADAIVALLGPALPEEQFRQSIFGLWNVHGPVELLRVAGARWNRRMVTLRNVTAAEAIAVHHEVPAGAATNAAACYAASPTPAPHPATFLDPPGGGDSVGVFSFGLPAWSMGPAGQGKGAPAFQPATNWVNVADAVTAFVSLRAKSGRNLPQHVSLYNEPLAHWRGSHAQLVEYFRAARAGLKAANPDFLIGAPGLYSIRIADLESLAAHGLLELLDFIDMHAYVGGTPPEEDFRDNLVSLRNWLAAKGYGDLPIFLTEFGWTREAGTWQPPVDAHTQADYVTRSLAITWAEGIDAIVYFTLQFNTKNRGEAAFSLLRPDGAPTPAYTAFTALAKHLAAARPLGFFPLAPQAYAAIGARGSETLLVCWTSAGERTVTLPVQPASVRTLHGTPLPPARTLRLSVDPLLITLAAPGAEAAMPAVAEAQRFTALPALHASGLSVPALIGTHAVPAAGDYLAMDVDDAGRLTLTPLSFLQPLQLLSLEPEWPAGSPVPRIRALIKSNLNTGTETADVVYGARTASVELPPNGLRAVSFAVEGAVPAQNRTDTILLNAACGSFTNVLKWCPVSAPYDPTHSHLNDASIAALPLADFTDWRPYNTLANGSGSVADLRGAFAAAADRDGLVLRILVEDDEHSQPHIPAEPARAWAGDSIQFGIDLDHDRPWEAGFAGDGASETLGGHRVFEWTAAGDGTNETGMVYLHTSRAPALPANSLRPAISCTVRRHAPATEYVLRIPWAELSLEGPPPPKVIGFSLLVNDVDPSLHRPRHGIRLFDGIAAEKSPQQYGPLFLVPPAAPAAE